MKPLDDVLGSLAQLIRSGRFEELETDTFEIKPVPPTGGDWRERHKTACAFLNHRGGIILLGVKELSLPEGRQYQFTGWQSHAEPNLKEFPRQFTDRKGQPLPVDDLFPPFELRDFMNGQVALIYVDELSADRKYAFYRGKAYERQLTGDHEISPQKLEAQEEYRREAIDARELKPVPEVTVQDLDMDQLNEYITYLNRPTKIETLKTDLNSASEFMQRRSFVREGRVTTLGMLVCGRHPEAHLGFRCQVHGYVDIPQTIAQDKQDIIGNILPLMESSFAYVLRNIRVGVSVERGGTDKPEYPEQLLRETINNALAHRDYSINRQTIIAVKPGQHVSIQNPGAFRERLLIEYPDHPIPVRRIIPEAKPRNPKLADVLRVFRKWEGRGIGMATLVNLCLADEIDLPYYRFGTEEVTLFLSPGPLLDERIERLFQSFDGFIEERLGGRTLTVPQKRVLAYLIKSEWRNMGVGYTIALSPGNNHESELTNLEKARLIIKHPVASSPIYPVFVVARELVSQGYDLELRAILGDGFMALKDFSKDVLGQIYRFGRFSKAGGASARQVGIALFHEKQGDAKDIKSYEQLFRKVAAEFKRLEKAGMIKKPDKTRRYSLNASYRKEHLV